jgi:hypothetical protein
VALARPEETVHRGHMANHRRVPVILLQGGVSR